MDKQIKQALILAFVISLVFSLGCATAPSQNNSNENVPNPPALPQDDGANNNPNNAVPQPPAFPE
ncbi:MAG: hypothetical protein AABW99_05200 [archaeon]